LANETHKGIWNQLSAHRMSFHDKQYTIISDRSENRPSYLF